MYSSFLFICLVPIISISLASCQPKSASDVVADIDGQPVTQTDLSRTGGKPLSQAREQLYKIERQKLDEHIAATLLTREANSRKISVATLLEQEVASKIVPVSANDVESFYDNNKARLRVELDKVRDQIHEYLKQQKIETRRNEFVAGLRSKAKIINYLTPPKAYRVEVATVGAPARGTEKASVTIVKFEDFQCPYCKTVQPRFTELLKKYDGKVRLVHKDLPLDELHPQARQAAEAARCAGDQGKFWEYHDKLYERSPKASSDDLKSFAKEVGLNLESFGGCFTSGKHKVAVQRDLAEGAKLGLTGTPAFYINGRELVGSQPLEAFTAIIDEELALAK